MKAIGTWAKRILVLGALALSVVACGGPVAVASGSTLPIALTEGQAYWVQFDNQQPASLPATAEISWDDEIWTSGQSAALQLADGSLIRIGPNSRLSVRRPFAANGRPIFRLTSGRLDIEARSSGFSVESYREVPLALRIERVNVILDPQGNASQFSLRFDADTAKAEVTSGVVDVRAADVRGTLEAEWRAELVPGEMLKIIPPVTPTPIASPTSAVSPTPTPTWTPTATATSIPTIRRTFTASTATPTNPPAATNPPDSGGGGSNPPPAPTNPPPPTNTPPPPPTDTPAPPPTDPRPTP
jgi:hypothetical protein